MHSLVSVCVVHVAMLTQVLTHLPFADRCVSGTRVVAKGKQQSVGGIDFLGYGAHFDAYPHDYLTAAAALGTTEDDVDEFVSRLKKSLNEWKKQCNK